MKGACDARRTSRRSSSLPFSPRAFSGDNRRMNDALARLIRQLRGAYSGELAAGVAYRGHWRSVSDPAEGGRIRANEEGEGHDPGLVGAVLRTLGARPSRVHGVAL